ncbi:PLC-like phosphodiesterase [Nemania sp. FL0916]|nr:PLC-like phosphodiesterase [Nemania sp. FL0916]
MRLSMLALLLAQFALGLASGDGGSGNGLAQLALDKLISDGRDVFGSPGSSSRLANWMAEVPDDTPMAQLNIPGTHDAATWNYSQTTQDGLADATRCDGTTALPARVYRCQRRSIADALAGGIRFFDLRFALDPLDARLVFWHGPALLSDTAAVDDVLFGFYAWLDAHPSEMVLLSFQYESGTRANASSDARVQHRLFDALTTSPAARRYVHQGKGVLETLGAVRGKIVLFRRFDLDMLPQEYEAAIPGLHMSPTKWLDNSRGFELVFNDTGGAAGTAFIEDFYHPDNYTTVADNINAKFEAAQAHLQLAATQDKESLFVTFTSGTHVEVDPPVFPVVMALGSRGEFGEVRTPALRGVNHRLLELLKQMKGERLGIVVMDFFEEPQGLVEALLDL